MADALWMNCPVTGGPPQYTAAELRQDMAFGGTFGGRDLGARQGVRPGGTQWSVSISASTITVKPGVGLVDPGLTVAQGPYWTALPADQTFSLVAAHATSPRKDIVVIRIYDHDEDGSGLRTAVAEYLPGIAAPSPVEPAVPAGAVRIATIDVPAQGGGNPAVTQNAPFTVAPGGVLPVRNATEQAAVVPYSGMAIYRLDGIGLLIWTGAAWVQPQNLLGLQTTAMAGKKLLSGLASVDAITGQTHTTTVVPFGTTFATPPIVTLTLAQHGNYFWHLEGLPTTTQMTIAIGKIDGTAFAATVTINMHWHAIG